MDKSVINSELVFRAVRSSGSGGQHVNKVSTKIELSFDVLNSKGLTEEERNRLLKKWKNKLTKKSVLKLTSQATRSQGKNKKRVLEKFWEKLKKAMQPRKKRKATKPGKKQNEKRIREKKKQSEKKLLRKNISLNP